MKKVLATVLVLILGLSVLVGCGAGGSALEGRYTPTAWEINGVDYYELLQQASENGNEIDEMYIEFNADGTFKMELGDDDGDGTYKVAGNKVTLTADGEDLEATTEGNTVIIEMTRGDDSMRLVFEKS